MTGTQRPEGLQRKLGGVDGTRGDQRFRAGDHDPGVGLVTDGGGRARVGGGRAPDLPRIPRSAVPIACEAVAPFLGGDSFIDRLPDEVVTEAQFGAG